MSDENTYNWRQGQKKLTKPKPSPAPAVGPKTWEWKTKHGTVTIPLILIWVCEIVGWVMLLGFDMIGEGLALIFLGCLALLWELVFNFDKTLKD